ncbi:MAG: hypothetical protein ACOVQG_04020 [Crocinitomicaceae bacterium]|jgi:hypothetical protein
MSTTDIFYAIGDAFQWAFLFYDNVGNIFNDILLLLGFFGFYYWMNIQRKLNAKAMVNVEIKGEFEWYKMDSTFSGKQINGSNQLIDCSGSNFTTTRVLPGMRLTGTGIPAGANVVSVSGSTVTISANATSNSNSAIFTTGKQLK